MDEPEVPACYRALHMLSASQLKNKENLISPLDDQRLICVRLDCHFSFAGICLQVVGYQNRLDVRPFLKFAFYCCYCLRGLQVDIVYKALLLNTKLSSIWKLASSLCSTSEVAFGKFRTTPNNINSS